MIAIVNVNYVQCNASAVHRNVGARLVLIQEPLQSSPLVDLVSPEVRTRAGVG